jgi:hypothetical protein
VVGASEGKDGCSSDHILSWKTEEKAFNSQHNLEDSFLHSCANPASYSMDTGILSMGVKQSQCEATSTPPLPHILMAWWLINGRDKFTLLLIANSNNINAGCCYLEVWEGQLHCVQPELKPMTTYFKLLQMLLTGSSLKTDNEHWG